MKKILALLLVSLTLALAALSAHAASMEDLQFDDQARIANRELVLNGLGIRKLFIFKAYVAGLYLIEKVNTGQAALNLAGPKRIQMRMMMEVGPKDIKQALIDGMRKHVTEAQWAAMQDRVAQFSAIIDSAGAARVGDSINLDYIPNQGLLLSVNNVPKGGAIPGQDFYNAMMEIYVGEDPVDTRLRGGLLGQP